MYEHSYHIDFGAKAASYVDIFMDYVRWDNAEQLVRTVDIHAKAGAAPKS
jgi:superoxide dismutase